MPGSLPTVGVIGAGIIGSWTALHLAERGVATTLIEQFPLPHTRGSSHGLSRAFRLLGELELDRLDYSLKRWKALEAATSDILFVKTGLLNFGPPGDADLEKYMAVLRAAGRPVEFWRSDTLAVRFPMLRYPAGMGAAWDPNGGILIAHRCLSAVQSQYMKGGGRVLTGRVLSVASEERGGVRVDVRSRISGEPRSESFDQLVVCAGPWTAKLIPQMNGMLRTLLTPVTYWRDPTDSYGVAAGLPILFNARLTDVYGLPAFEYPGLLKMLFHGGPRADPDARDVASVEAHVEKVRRYVETHLPHVDYRKPAIVETCMYTMTPDGFPVIDRLASNLVVGCGFSGSGFKHAPATGRMLCDLAIGRPDLTPEGFRRDRYLVGRWGLR